MSSLLTTWSQNLFIPSAHLAAYQNRDIETAGWFDFIACSTALPVVGLGSLGNCCEGECYFPASWSTQNQFQQPNTESCIMEIARRECNLECGGISCTIDGEAEPPAESSYRISVTETKLGRLNDKLFGEGKRVITSRSDGEDGSSSTPLV